MLTRCVVGDVVGPVGRVVINVRGGTVSGPSAFHPNYDIAHGRLTIRLQTFATGKAAYHSRATSQTAISDTLLNCPGVAHPNSSR